MPRLPEQLNPYTELLLKHATNNNNGNGNNHHDQTNNKTEYLNLRSHSNVIKLTHQIVQGKLYAAAERLIVVCPGCEPDWKSPEVQELFQALAGLPCLQQIKLNCVGLLDTAFPLSLLTLLIHHCPRLEGLELDDVALTTRATLPQQQQAEVNDLANAIAVAASNGSLKEFRLFGCLADDTLMSSSSSPSSSSLSSQQQSTSVVPLDPLWASLAGLQRVEMDAVDDGLLGSIQPDTVGHLARSSTLTLFHLTGFTLDNDCLTVLADALPTNTTLVDLSFDLYSVGHPGKGAFALAESLRCNQSVEKLHMSISHAWNDDAFLQAMALALTTDCTLKSLIIGTCAVISDATAKAFCDMIQYNHVLELLQLSRYNGPWKPLLHYYLKLNSQRRGYFHSNFGSLTRQTWIEQGLAPLAEDLDGLFYFLQMNPVLCQIAY